MEPKKRSLAAAERGEFLRAAWRALVAEEVDAKRLVFVDEMGANDDVVNAYVALTDITLLSSDRVRKAAENLASASACCRGNNI